MALAIRCVECGRPFMSEGVSEACPDCLAVRSGFRLQRMIPDEGDQISGGPPDFAEAFRAIAGLIRELEDRVLELEGRVGELEEKAE